MSKRFFPAALAVGLFSATVSVQAATIEFSNVNTGFHFENVTNLWTGSFTVDSLFDNSGVTLSTSASVDSFDPFLVVWEVLTRDAAGNPLTGNKIDFNDDFVFADSNAKISFGVGGLADGTYYFTIGNSTNDLISDSVNFSDIAASFAYNGPNPGILYPNVANGEWLVSISGVVPEPETWAMLLAGLGVVGSIARRRRTR
ncbi:MAG: PEPxxWA-CTERM sorting domain-containing protein [Azoarcus sp.]|jgi:hypothetical protein|nr:PEPxxWA-CTERM sorting domain-containing protein [Azoarcus sp.]